MEPAISRHAAKVQIKRHTGSARRILYGRRQKIVVHRPPSVVMGGRQRKPLRSPCPTDTPDSLSDNLCIRRGDQPQVHKLARQLSNSRRATIVHTPAMAMGEIFQLRSRHQRGRFILCLVRWGDSCAKSASVRTSIRRNYWGHSVQSRTLLVLPNDK